jgi:type IV fimbrial biogenesis protein FimT
MTRGFTLLEMLITLFILSILMTVSVPSYRKISQRYEMRQTAQALVGIFNQARSEALLTQQDLWIHFYTHPQGSQFGWNLSIHSDETQRSFATALSGAVSSYSSDNMIVSSTSTVRKIESLNGLPTTGGNVTFHLVGQSQKLKLKYANVTGRIRVCAAEMKAYGFNKC